MNSLVVQIRSRAGQSLAGSGTATGLLAGTHTFQISEDITDIYEAFQDVLARRAALCRRSGEPYSDLDHYDKDRDDRFKEEKERFD